MRAGIEFLKVKLTNCARSWVRNAGPPPRWSLKAAQLRDAIEGPEANDAEDGEV